MIRSVSTHTGNILHMTQIPKYASNLIETHDSMAISIFPLWDCTLIVVQSMPGVSCKETNLKLNALLSTASTL